MTNEQRKQLLTACQDSYLIHSKPRDEFVKIRYCSFLIKIDHCLKHGTGTGKIVAIATSSPHPKEDLPSITEIDQMLIQWAKNYRTELSNWHDGLNDILEEIELDNKC